MLIFMTAELQIRQDGATQTGACAGREEWRRRPEPAPCGGPCVTANDITYRLINRRCKPVTGK
jgi:hypothetical protein